MSKRTKVSSVCSVKWREDCEIYFLLADVYDADSRTGAIVVDTRQVCQFALFRKPRGGGTQCKLSTAYAYVMIGFMVVNTYCGSLSLVYTGEGALVNFTVPRKLAYYALRLQIKYIEKNRAKKVGNFN